MEIELLKDKFTEVDVRALNPLVLAFIGDAVYEVFIRTHLVDLNRETCVNKLHRKTVEFVKAHSQCEIMNNIMDQLCEEEIAIFKRGRNTKSNTVPKSASVQDYRMATGFEALIGFLYLTGRHERLNEIFKIILMKSKEEEIN